MSSLERARAKHGSYTGCRGEFVGVELMADADFDDWKCTDCGVIVRVSSTEFEARKLEATVSIKDVGQRIPTQAELTPKHTDAETRLATILYCDCIIKHGALCDSCIGIMVKAGRK